jgi:hypothetical protein
MIYEKHQFKYLLRSLCRDTHRYLQDPSVLNVFKIASRHLVILPSTRNVGELITRSSSLGYTMNYTIEFDEPQTIAAAVVALQ